MTPSAILSLADVTSETIAGIWATVYSNLSSAEVGRSMLVCKSFKDILPSVIKSISCSKPPFTQQGLGQFARMYRNLGSLTIQLNFNPDLEALDWSAVSFPHLESLSLFDGPTAHVVFNKTNTPSLKSLQICNEQAAGRFELDLPNLESLILAEFHVHEDAQFRKSRSACPKLKTFYSHKLLGLGCDKQVVHLPSCTSLQLYDCDDLHWLELHAPNLCSMNVYGCYTLEHFRLHPQKGSPCHVKLTTL